jgi:hypothetical protein
VSSFEHEIYEEALIPGTGHRIDFNLTDEDAVESVVVEIQAAELLAATAGSTALGGVVQVDNVVCPAFAALDDMDYFVLTDINGDEWAAAVDKTGASAEPIGVAWLAVPVARRTFVDVSTAVTDADVATAIDTALNLLAGFAAALTTDAVTTPGTIIVTQVARASVAVPVTYNLDDSTAGTLTTAVVVVGVDSNVDDVANTIAVTPDPGWLTGRAVSYASTGVLPNGLVGTTSGFVIRIAAGVYQIAATLADALAGTEIALVDQGAAGSTITITATAGINAYIFNSMKKLTDAELTTAITTVQIFNVNNLQTISYSLGQVGLNFAVNLINQITLAPSLAVGPITLPAVLLPHFTIRVDAPTLRYSEIRITRRGTV